MPAKTQVNSPVVLTREGGHVVGMQRRRLLLAMGEVLAEVGVADATVGRISKRAGVSRRTFYEVFEDREECFLTAFDQAIERIAQEILSAYARERRWSARVRAALTALLEHFDAHPGVARMCVIETLRAGPEVLERRRRILGVLIGATPALSGPDRKRRRRPHPRRAQRLVAHPTRRGDPRDARGSRRREPLNHSIEREP